MTGSRRIIFDTETTGSERDDRIIEIGLVEVIGHVPTGRQMLHRFNPQGRDIHWGAARIHGITARDLAGKPLFGDLAVEILEFVADARLYAHNAPFDARMLEAELGRIGLNGSRRHYVDTVKIAKRAWPGQKCGIDALMERLMPGQRRGKHNALEDALILARLMEHFVPAHDHEVDALLNANTRRKPAAKQVAAGGGEARAARAPVQLPGLGQGMKEGVAQAIARAVTLEDAAALRTGGSDGWSAVTRTQLLEVLAPQHAVESLMAGIEGLDERHGDAALRWVCRGLSLELAVGRERFFMEKALEREAQVAPSMSP